MGAAYKTVLGARVWQGCFSLMDGGVSEKEKKKQPADKQQKHFKFFLDNVNQI